MPPGNPFAYPAFSLCFTFSTISVVLHHPLWRSADVSAAHGHLVLVVCSDLPIIQVMVGVDPFLNNQFSIKEIL